MAKAVLLSIRPEWAGKIASGEKTVEVRKNRPKLETPFKCYIYCTKDAKMQWWTGSRYSYADDHSHNAFDKCGNGKVIGEFICDTYVIDNTFGHDPLFNAAACMSEDDTVDYANGSPLYGWHISNLEIYDTPKELIEFHTWKKCKSCSKSGYESTACIYDENCMVPVTITKAPQSWCYVEDEGGGDKC